VSPEPVVRISALEHYAYCHRQCALIHGDGVWHHNEHTVHGIRAHHRVDNDRHRKERGRLVMRAIPLWSEYLGLSGRADVVEVEKDIVRPVEYKSGIRHGNAAELQLCAQALCLEEMLDTSVMEGYIWYGGPRRRERILMTTDLRQTVLETIRSVRRQLRTGVLPRAPNDQRCTECQLRHHCLPEVTGAPERVVRYMKEVVFSCAT